MRFFVKKGRRERERKKHQSHAREIREREISSLARAKETTEKLKKEEEAL